MATGGWREKKPKKERLKSKVSLHRLCEAKGRRVANSASPFFPGRRVNAFLGVTHAKTPLAGAQTILNAACETIGRQGNQQNTRRE